jgi:hypothetical protein
MFSITPIYIALSVIAPAPDAKVVRASVDKSLPMLMKAALGHMEKKTCFGCHNQAFAMIAFDRAEKHDFNVDKKDRQKIVDHIWDFININREVYESGKGTGGGVDTAGWALLTLHHGKMEADDETSAVVQYLLKKDTSRDHWNCSSNRPPSEASHFCTSYLGIKGLQNWANDSQKVDAKKRIETVKVWIEKTPAKDTEDRVFRLLGLQAAKSPKKLIEEATKELLKTQHFDGGFGQLDTLPSDAYATGQALAALHEAGGLSTNSPPRCHVSVEHAEIGWDMVREVT